MMLDGGPSRVPRPTDRRAAPRAGLPRRQPDGVQYSEAESRAISQPTGVQPDMSTSKASKKWLKILIAIIGVIVAVVIGWLVWSSMGGVAATIDNDKHQVVFFPNGQFYFGKLEVVDKDYLKLTDVFYVQTDETEGGAESEETPAGDGNMRLIKLGEEVHGPEDVMIINRDQVLFFENLKPDSRVSQLIREYRSSN